MEMGRLILFYKIFLTENLTAYNLYLTLD